MGSKDRGATKCPPGPRQSLDLICFPAHISSQRVISWSEAAFCVSAKDAKFYSGGGVSSGTKAGIMSVHCSAARLEASSAAVFPLARNEPSALCAVHSITNSDGML